MSIEGYYYLHTNKELIYKRDHDFIVADFRDSDFVMAFWPMDQADRMSAWSLLVEALAAGAKKERVLELAEKWKCNNADAEHYAKRLNLKFEMDGNSIPLTSTNWHVKGEGFINLQESVSGFGDSALEAMADMCNQLGYSPSKMWGSTFTGLVAGNETS